MTDYVNPNAIVSTQWLADHLNDPKVRIVEVDMNPQQNQNAHILGAVFWNIFTDLARPDLRLNLEASAVEGLLSRSGITPETTVVAYGSYPGTGGCIFWLLTLFGHTRVRVLNGGHQKWKAEGRPVTENLSTVAATEYRIRQPLNHNMRVLPEEIQASFARPEQVLLDVRTPEEYAGEQFLMKPPEGSERAGHIPGAIYAEHLLTLNEDGTFKSFDELKALYESKGITPDKEIFPYCAIGARAGYVWFVLKYLLGYPKVRNYDGSWNEWSRLPNAAIETSMATKQ